MNYGAGSVFSHRALTRLATHRSPARSLPEGRHVIPALAHTPLQLLTLVAQPRFSPLQLGRQVGQVMTGDMLQISPLQQVPDAFIRVQLWCRAWQLFELQALGCPTGEEGSDDQAAMNRRPIPDHEQLTWKLAQEQAKKTDDIFGALGVLLYLHEEPSIRCQTADRRKMIARERHPQDRRMSSRRPGADGHRHQINSRLIDPNDGLLLSFRLFLSAGQRSSRQALIAASSRWVACWIGCCTLQPTARKSRLTWAG